MEKKLGLSWLVGGWFDDPNGVDGDDVLLLDGEVS